MFRPELHVLSLPQLPGSPSLEEQVAAALRGGADVIQLRDKSASPAALAGMIGRLLPLVRAAGARLLVNDHWELARDLGAHGAHVGPADAPVELVRASCPHPFVVGASARTVEAALRASAAGADYVGVGPVYGTSSKPDAPGAVGVARVSEVAGAVGIPVIGIGGIDETNAAAVIRAGAAGVAVLSAIGAATDPETAARRIRKRIDGAGGAARVAGTDPD